VFSYKRLYSNSLTRYTASERVFAGVYDEMKDYVGGDLFEYFKHHWEQDPEDEQEFIHAKSSNYLLLDTRTSANLFEAGILMHVFTLYRSELVDHEPDKDHFTLEEI
jgi:hypothetical protein